MLGIDVSSHNGNLNWNKIIADNVSCAIIRLGWGGNYKSQDDVRAEYNMNECERLGIPYGVYIYSYALSEEMAVDEANHILRVLGSHKPTFGIWFDMEDADNYKKNKGIKVYNQRRLITDICNAFCKTVKNKGYEVGIYASKDYWKNVLMQDELTDYRVWLAHWGVDKPSIDCDIWQYSDSGNVSGNGSTRMDMDIIYEDKFIAETRKSNKEVAIEVFEGKWGNGEERKRKLKEAGYNYSAVQRIVNSMCK